MAATTLNTLRFINEYNLAAHNTELRALLCLIDGARDTPGMRSTLRRIEEISLPFAPSTSTTHSRFCHANSSIAE